MARRRSAHEVVTIYWRDIPAQVNGQHGRERHQVVLPAKFQRAIDRAKHKAGIRTAAADVAQWRRTSRAVNSDVVTAACAEAARLTAEFSRERLGALAFAGGWIRDVPGERPTDPPDSSPSPITTDMSEATPR